MSKIKAPQPGFPTTRLRRNRQDGWTRKLVAENHLSVQDLIWPIFVHNGKEPKIKIPTMPDVERLSVQQLVEQVKQAKALGIPMVAVFPVVNPELKSAEA